MNPVILLLVLLLVLALLPVYPYSRSWGPYPSGLLFVILVVLLILYLR